MKNKFVKQKEVFMDGATAEKNQTLGGIAEKRAIYSASLMKTQIGLVEKTLMDQKYFGEK